MAVKLLTEHHFQFLSSKGGCIGSPESALVKMPHCLKSHVAAQLLGFMGCLQCMIYSQSSHTMPCGKSDIKQKPCASKTWL